MFNNFKQLFKYKTKVKHSEVAGNHKFVIILVIGLEDVQGAVTVWSVLKKFIIVYSGLLFSFYLSLFLIILFILFHYAHKGIVCMFLFS